MHPDKANDAVCRCGHGRLAHEHYHAGTECALCLDCPRFRPATGLWRLVATLRRRSRSDS